MDEIRRKLSEEKCPFFNEDTNGILYNLMYYIFLRQSTKVLVHLVYDTCVYVSAYASFPLMQYVVSKVQDVCKQYNEPEKLLAISLSNCMLPTATFATKNKRRQMEDRHVIVNDLAKLFNRQVRMKIISLFTFQVQVYSILHLNVTVFSCALGLPTDQLLRYFRRS